jgi:hypothetical protein
VERGARGQKAGVDTGESDTDRDDINGLFPMKNKDEIAQRIYRAIEIGAHILVWTALIVVALLILTAGAMMIHMSGGAQP